MPWSCVVTVTVAVATKREARKDQINDNEDSKQVQDADSGTYARFKFLIQLQRSITGILK